MILESEDLENALMLLERTEIKMPKTFAGVGANNTGGVLAQVMAEIGNKGQITFSELLAIFYQDADKRTLEAMIETLESMGYAKRSFPGNGEVMINYVRED
jgi:Holliday junction resolvasome RuvABC DNA-binding subunit